MALSSPARDVPHAVKVAGRAFDAHMRILTPLRAVARRHGYALAVHGSLARDIDLIAIPWTDAAGKPEPFVREVVEEVRRVLGFCVLAAKGADGQTVNDDDYLPGTPKPQGRQAWTIVVSGGTWIDLSVMPRSA